MMSAEENRSEGNLILMCLKHASAIDDPNIWRQFTKDLLQTWKREQLAEYTKIRQGWILNDQMADEVISGSEKYDGPVYYLGGSGGQAPGSGGGGGGAVGTNARGGDGGGGGSFVNEIVDIEPLYQADWNGHAEIEVGKAGVGGSLPGEHGGLSGETFIRFRKHDGTILKQMRAKAGHSGRSGASYPSVNSIDFSSDELASSFYVTALMPVNSIDMREDIFYIFGGNWSRYNVRSVPEAVIWTFACSASFQPITTDISRTIFLSINDPSGREASCVAVEISSAVLRGGSAHWIS